MSDVNPILIDMGDEGGLAELLPTGVHSADNCELLGAPNEMGMKCIDHKRKLPLSITVRGVIQADDWGRIKNVYQKMWMDEISDRWCFVFTKNAAYERMQIESIREINTSERFDGIEVEIRFSECLLADQPVGNFNGGSLL